MKKAAPQSKKGSNPISLTAKAKEAEHKARFRQKKVNSKSGPVPGGRKSESKIPGKKS